MPSISVCHMSLHSEACQFASDQTQHCWGNETAKTCCVHHHQPDSSVHPAPHWAAVSHTSTTSLLYPFSSGRGISIEICTVWHSYASWQGKVLWCEKSATLPSPSAFPLSSKSWFWFTRILNPYICQQSLNHLPWPPQAPTYLSQLQGWNNPGSHPQTYVFKHSFSKRTREHLDLCLYYTKRAAHLFQYPCKNLSKMKFSPFTLLCFSSQKKPISPWVFLELFNNVGIASRYCSLLFGYDGKCWENNNRQRGCMPEGK